MAVPVLLAGQRADAALLQSKRSNQSPIADECRDSEPEIDNLGLGEVSSQLIVENFGRLRMITREHVGEPHGGFLARSQYFALAVIDQLRNLLIGQPLLPCQGNATVQSKIAVISFRYFEAKHLGQLHIDAAAGLENEGEVVIDE